MASTLVRVTDFVPATPILSGEVDSEFNQIVNLLNATSTSVKASIKVSDSGDPPLELNQLSTGPILKGFQAGVENFRIRNNGGVRTPGIYDTNDNEQLLFSLTASAVNEFTAKNAATGNPPQLQATGGDANIGITLVPKGTGVVKIQSGAPVAGEDAANKTYVDGRKVSFVTGMHVTDPSAAPTGFGLTLLPIPEGGSYTLTKLKIAFTEGSHTAGGNLVFTAQVQGVGILDTIALDNTNNTINTVYEKNFSDLAVSANALIVIFISTRTGTITERAVSVWVEGFRTSFS
jgi:hypothetical protein